MGSLVNTATLDDVVLNSKPRFESRGFVQTAKDYIYCMLGGMPRGGRTSEGGDDSGSSGSGGDPFGKLNDIAAGILGFFVNRDYDKYGWVDFTQDIAKNAGIGLIVADNLKYLNIIDSNNISYIIGASIAGGLTIVDASIKIMKGIKPKKIKKEGELNILNVFKGFYHFAKDITFGMLAGGIINENTYLPDIKLLSEGAIDVYLTAASIIIRPFSKMADEAIAEAKADKIKKYDV